MCFLSSSEMAQCELPLLQNVCKVCLRTVLAKAIFEAHGIIAICIAGCAILFNLHLHLFMIAMATLLKS